MEENHEFFGEFIDKKSGIFPSLNFKGKKGKRVHNLKRL